jgi:phenylpyruvate tautomerase PptA (4-oxalocrotonate tautomerase family)
LTIQGILKKERNMAVAILEMLEGSSIEEKRQLAKDITAAFVKIGIPADTVQIIMRENPKSCWADAGKMCSDFQVPPGA